MDTSPPTLAPGPIRATIHDLVKRYLADGLDAGLGDINDWDVSEVTDMSHLFEDAETFNSPIDKWDVSNVTRMDFMFSGAKKFNQPINQWNTGQVVDMDYMFSTAIAFNQPLDSWDVAGVTTMYGMFMEARAFNQPLDSWDVSSVTTMDEMFYIALAFNQPLDSWGARFHMGVSRQDMFKTAIRFRQRLPDWALTVDEEIAMGISQQPKLLAALDHQRKQNQAADTGPPRIGLMIFTHGADLVSKKRLTGKNKFFEFALARENITILNSGSGQCGLLSWSSPTSQLERSEAIQLATRPHRPETYETMQQVQQIVKPMYATLQRGMEDIPGKGEKEAVEKDLHGKMYHPHLDRGYSEYPQYFTCQIVQVFHPAAAYKDGLVGRDLKDPRVIQTFRDTQPTEHGAEIAKFADHFTGDYYRVKLSEIVAFCALLGFEYVNVYEFACRRLNRSSSGMKIKSVKIADKVNAVEGNTSHRSTMGFGGTRRHKKRKMATTTRGPTKRVRRGRYAAAAAAYRAPHLGAAF